MASRGLKTVRGNAAPSVKNSTLPKLGAYCGPDSVPHVGNSIANPGGNKPKMKKPTNAVASKKR
jgi:hypothetical protein